MFLALGSNLGDRRAHLREAILALKTPDFTTVRQSPIYETAPQGYTEQDWFLNMVIEAETDLSPEDLLTHCASVERQHGRERSVPDGPRTLDVDILFYGSATLRTDRLQLPHPRYWRRRFVLQPLADLEPEFHDPQTGRPIRDMLAAVEDQPLRAFGE